MNRNENIKEFFSIFLLPEGVLSEGVWKEFMTNDVPISMDLNKNKTNARSA